VFFVLSGGLAGYNAWDVIEGPELVPARGNATYLLKPRFVGFAIPLGRAFRVLVFEAENFTLKGESEVHYIRPSELTWLRNPDLAYWSYDVVKGVEEPFAWDFVSCREGVGEEAWAGEVDGAALLKVEGLERSEGEWLMAGLWQSVEFPAELKIKVKPMFSTPLSPKPSRVVGVEVGYGQWDWSTHRRVSKYDDIPYRAVWVVFTNETQEPVLVRSELSENLALYYVPVEVGEWNEVEVNVTRLIQALNWTPPEPELFTYRGGGLLEPQPYLQGSVAYLARRAELTLFVAAYPWDPRAEGRFEAYFDFVDTVPYEPT